MTASKIFVGIEDVDYHQDVVQYLAFLSAARYSRYFPSNISWLLLGQEGPPNKSLTQVVLPSFIFFMLFVSRSYYSYLEMSRFMVISLKKA